MNPTPTDKPKPGMHRALDYSHPGETGVEICICHLQRDHTTAEHSPVPLYATDTCAAQPTPKPAEGELTPLFNVIQRNANVYGMDDIRHLAEAIAKLYDAKFEAALPLEVAYDPSISSTEAAQEVVDKARQRWYGSKQA